MPYRVAKVVPAVVDPVVRWNGIGWRRGNHLLAEDSTELTEAQVTFNEVTSTSSEHAHGPHEHGNKRHPSGGTTIRMSSITGEVDDGDYATLRGSSGRSASSRSVRTSCPFRISSSSTTTTSPAG
uniref:Uncharacterized protein n=1 Tax=Anopheles funestus TaxID=62324 RepID=A0A4Y0BE60_ANOFN